MSLSNIKRGRETLICAGTALGIVLVASALLPIWFPWVLNLVLRSHRIEYESYQRVGYARFALQGVRLHNRGAQLKIDRLESLLPTAWLCRRYLGNPADSAPYLRLNRWRLQIKHAKADAMSRPRRAEPGSISQALENLDSLISTLGARLPSVDFSDGEVALGPKQIKVPNMKWVRGRLSATVKSPEFNESLSLEANLSHKDILQFSAQIQPIGLETRGRFLHKKQEWEIKGYMVWPESQVEFTAQFGRAGWWPEKALITANQFRLPPHVLALEHYQDSTGAFALRWENGQFNLNLLANAKPSQGTTRLSPVKIVVEAEGDTRTVSVKKFDISMPWLKGKLTENVRLNTEGKLLDRPVSFDLSFDLSKISRPELAGTIKINARLEPTTNRFPYVVFNLTGAGLRLDDWERADAKVVGDLVWPRLKIKHGNLIVADGSALQVAAQIDLKSRNFLDGDWQFQGRIPKRWLAPGFEYKKIQTAGTFSGPATNLAHSGEITVTGFSSPRLKPLELQAHWQGTNLDVAQAKVEAAAGDSKLLVNGSFHVGRTIHEPTTGVLKDLTLNRNGKAFCQLEQPCPLFFCSAPINEKNAAKGWSMGVDHFRWIGTQREMRLHAAITWPDNGEIKGHCHGFELNDWSDFLSNTHDLSISQFDLFASWKRGPVNYATIFQGNLVTKDKMPLAVEVKIKGTGNELEVDSLNISRQQTAIATAKGTLPLSLVPAQWPQAFVLAEDRAIHLQARTEPDKTFWQHVANLTGVRLTAPMVDLAIDGTPATPAGHFRAQADLIQVDLPDEKSALPKMENFKLEADLKRDKVNLRTLELQIEGQPVRATGELPLSKGSWLEFMAKGTLPDWRESNAHLEISNAQIAPFAHYLPRLLAPQGRLTLDLALQPGGKLRGQLELAEAATRPLPAVGPIRDIEARLVFSNRTASIEKFNAYIGGQAVTVSGQVKPQAPFGADEFDLTVRGRNVPLAREAGLILRSDIDVRLSQQRAKAAVISGELVLRKSFFGHDLNLLVPHIAEPLRRPPYFSIQEQPFADWRLDLKIHGDRFLGIRSPVFRGEASAAFQLKGTLKEPLALGEAQLNSGVFKFPFASLDVEQGSISLTSRNPYRPQLYVTASARSFGYNVQMEVTGSADTPLVVFRSTPPLGSGEIAQMLTAGQVPQHESAFTMQDKASRLAVFLGRELLTRLGASEEAAERLTIRSGEYISEEGKETYQVEYQLSDRWSAFGEYDRFEAFNAGLKYRIYSK